MEEKATLLETLFEKAEAYSKTNIDIFKLKSIDKSADVVSSLVSKLAVIIVVSLIALMVNIGLALWIGELLGKTYFGFFAVAGGYILIAIIVSVFRHQLIKTPINDAIIIQMLKEKAA